MANMRIIGFNDRTAELRRIRLGYEGDNLVERLEFMLPEIAHGQTATLLIAGADAVKLDRTDEGRYAVDLTRDMIGPDGEREAYVRVDGAGGEVWQSAPMRLITGALPDVEEEIEKIYPTAVGQMLTAMAEHSGEMVAQEERIEQEADRAERAADALNDPDVVARTLVPEGEASAEWTVVNGKPTLTLNIPRGKPGDKGDKGDKGDAPIKGIDYTDGVGIADITVERAINPNNRDEWKVTFKTTDGRETSYVVADGKDGRTPIKGLDYTDGAPGPGITDLTITERTDAAGKRYHQVVIMWEEALNGSIIKAGQSFNVYDGVDGEPGKSGVHYGPDEPTDPEVNVWINPEGEGEYIDDTLTQAGRAADARATGERIGKLSKEIFEGLFARTKNLFDMLVARDGYYISKFNGNLVAGAEFVSSDFIPVIPGKNYIGNFTNHLVWYDASQKYITGYNLVFSAIAPANAAYARIDFNTSAISADEVMFVEGDTLPTSYVPYYKLRGDTANAIINTKWEGMTWLSYGDSITAMGNASGGYQSIVDKMLRFGMSYRRGVGGQTYKVNDNTFYANSDGSYAGRYGQDGLIEAPAGTTTHLGYFASWDRITAMIPENIRETIDLVVLCGGTNDHASVEDVGTDGAITIGTPVWVAGSTTDAEWAASAYYNGGDYDITTFAGAIASTIVKMRLWCPNAVVVLATPYPRWDTGTMQQYTNSNGLDARAMCDIQIATAKYMACPVCDANALCGVAAANFAATVIDGVHPNATGQKMYGEALADCIATISPK